MNLGNPFLCWTTRIPGILLDISLSLFALDVFEQGGSIVQSLIAFALHLIPALTVVIVLIIAWRWEWLGALLSLFLAVLYVVWGWGRFHVSVYLVIVVPLVVIGEIFLVNGIDGARHQREETSSRLFTCQDTSTPSSILVRMQGAIFSLSRPVSLTSQTRRFFYITYPEVSRPRVR